jgi:D-alanine transfer protein
MRRIILLYLVPFTAAVFLTSYISFSTRINTYFFPSKAIPGWSEISPYTDILKDHPHLEEILFDPNLKENTIYLLGSSELSEGGYAIPYTFIPNHYKNIRLQALGHAGNQCFSIFTQLLANSSRLPDTKIVFIISPGWFESKASKGTSSEVFLEYNSDKFLKKILHNHHPEDHEFKAYAEKRVNELYAEFNSPSLPLKLLNFEHKFHKSILHKAVYVLPMILDHHLISHKKKMACDRSECPDQIFEKGVPFYKPANTVKINWDSLLLFSRNEATKKVTNNSLGIEDTYYSEYIGNKRGRIQPVIESLNKELQDFKMLVQLAKAKHIDARFIISPLNPFYFQNQKEIQPTIDIIEKEITSAGFNFLNLLESDTARYEKAILHDVMHMSDYGWYQLDKYIISEYKLDSVTIDHYQISIP